MNPHRIKNLTIHFVLQESYNFWACSFYLPLYLRHPSSEMPVTVKPCQSVCKEVEKTCPFLIKGPDDDKAAGNPSFICKGKTGVDFGRSNNQIKHNYALP
jgi:hypothetical protein